MNNDELNETNGPVEGAFDNIGDDIAEAGLLSQLEKYRESAPVLAESEGSADAETGIQTSSVRMGDETISQGHSDLPVPAELGQLLSDKKSMSSDYYPTAKKMSIREFLVKYHWPFAKVTNFILALGFVMNISYQSVLYAIAGSVIASLVMAFRQPEFIAGRISSGILSALFVAQAFMLA